MAQASGPSFGAGTLPRTGSDGKKRDPENSGKAPYHSGGRHLWKCGMNHKFQN